MTLRALIEAKARKKATLPVLVGDAEAAAAEVGTLRAALDLHLRAMKALREGGGQPTEADEVRETNLREQLSAGLDRQRATVVNVEIQSLPPDEWDALCADLPEDPETGGYDITEMRAAIMAACCVDSELQDSEWWEQQFRRPEWSKGELLAVNMALLSLNLSTPSGFAGKG